jgi:pimeloyl-ACP methyl ester carboxylesterase
MLPQIMSRTPVWVWGLLALLMVLGLSLARTRVLSLKRLVIVPVVMMGLSLLGTVSAAGLSFTTVAMWLFGYAALVFALSRKPAAGESYDAKTQAFTVVGSYAPLIVIFAIFVTKYAVGVMQGMQAPLVHRAEFPAVIAALYGAFSGFFAGRALRVIQLSELNAASLLKHASRPLLKVLLLIAGLAALLVAAALLFGGPKPIAALSSINNPFATVNYSALPPTRSFKARDGAQLAYLHYPGAPSTAPPQRVVLVHGSSANARSMHVVAQGLAASGMTVDALDMRGHGASGERGHIAYIGQLEDDVADFMQANPEQGRYARDTLAGFSSGGGFVLRFAGSAQQALFSHYVLLSPYLRYDAPTAKPNNGGWASIGVPRMIALQVLNAMGIKAFNHLTVTQFALNDYAKAFLTPSYDFSLAANFGPHSDYAKDIAQAKGALRIVAGADDELFDTTQFASVFSNAGKAVQVDIVPSTHHIGLTLQSEAVKAIVNACKI